MPELQPQEPTSPWGSSEEASWERVSDTLIFLLKNNEPESEQVQRFVDLHRHLPVFQRIQEIVGLLAQTLADDTRPSDMHDPVLELATLLHRHGTRSRQVQEWLDTHKGDDRLRLIGKMSIRIGSRLLDIPDIVTTEREEDDADDEPQQSWQQNDDWWRNGIQEEN